MAMNKSERTEVEQLRRKVAQLEQQLDAAAGPAVVLPTTGAPDGLYSDDFIGGETTHRRISRSVTAVVNGSRIRLTVMPGRLDVNCDDALSLLPSASNSIQLVPTRRTF